MDGAEQLRYGTAMLERTFAAVLAAASLLVPLAASADDVWRWSDEQGHTHYSNVPGRVPRGAVAVGGSLGYVAGEPPEETAGEPPAVVEPSAAERLRTERRIRRRLGEIQAFMDGVRARQRARLEAYADSKLLRDWMVADQWMELKQEQDDLRAQLEALRAHDGPAS